MLGVVIFNTLMYFLNRNIANGRKFYDLLAPSAVRCRYISFIGQRFGATSLRLPN